MKRIVSLLMIICVIAACNNNKAEKEKYDRDKTDVSREKDDYTKSGKDAGQKTSTPDDNEKKEQTPNDQPPAQTGMEAGWTKANEIQFLNECTGTANVKVGPERGNQYCECVMQKLKAMYPSYSEAIKAIDNPSNLSETNKLIAQCNAQ